MPLKFADHLSIHQIAELWVAKSDTPLDLKDIEGALLQAAMEGEFEFPFKTASLPEDEVLPTNVDVRLQLQIETYGRDGKPINSLDLKKHAEGSLDLTRETLISMAGLQLWCDREEFAGWAQLRRMKRPNFLPPTPSTHDKEIVSTIAAETRCKKWLMALMELGPRDKVKADYRKEAKSQFGIGIRAFDRAWANAIKETGNKDWSKPGRKS